MSIVALKSEAYPLSPQVPLPSLPTAFSRRAALFGAVTATGFLGTAGAAAMGKGYARHTPSTLAPADARLVALCDKLHDNKAEGDDLCGAYRGSTATAYRAGLSSRQALRPAVPNHRNPSRHHGWHRRKSTGSPGRHRAPRL